MMYKRVMQIAPGEMVSEALTREAGNGVIIRPTKGGEWVVESDKLSDKSRIDDIVRRFAID